MSIQKIPGEFFHVFNRGVEKRDVFLDDEDRYRFIHDLYEFNDKDAVMNINYYFDSQRKLIREGGFKKAVKILQEMQRTKKRKVLVDVICFCLMPNHFHLIAKPLVENGLPLFMQKLGIGYTRYFNYKYERVGSLFQGTYKAKHLSDDTYFMHCTGYVHRNPLDLIEPDWKEEGIKDAAKAKKFLFDYKWSSFPDYVGKKNFPSVTRRDFLLKIFDNNSAAYKKFVLEWTLQDLELLTETKLTLD